MRGFSRGRCQARCMLRRAPAVPRAPVPGPLNLNALLDRTQDGLNRKSTFGFSFSVPALPPLEPVGCSVVQMLEPEPAWSRHRSRSRFRRPEELPPSTAAAGAAVPAIGCRPLHFSFFYGRDLVSRLETVTDNLTLHKLFVVVADVLSDRPLLGVLYVACVI
jgi:hypothetical protein